MISSPSEKQRDGGGKDNNLPQRVNGSVGTGIVEDISNGTSKEELFCYVETVMSLNRWG